MPSCEVRRYRPTDAAAVWEVHVLDLTDAMPIFSTDWATDLHDVERHYLREGDFLVGAYGDDVVATAGYLPEDEEVAELKRVRVRPLWKGTGVTRDLIRSVEGVVRDRGFDRMYLETNEHLSTKNGIVESLGYEQTDRDPLPEWGVDLLYYEKPL